MSVKGLLLFASLALIGALTLITLPAPLNLASGSGFDAAAAANHLRFIACKARPLGSEHHRAVREYLVAHFRSLGCETEVQDTRISSRRLLHGLPIRVKNVIARLRGTVGGSKAVALAAHYDSTPLNAAASRGAGDDGAAVAALLEVARVLSLERPKNDVIFLITDGEELGLLGARAFVDEHPWARDVAVVFNFEARGTAGPSIMFQTSPGNAWLVGQYARFAPHPVTSSISKAVYRFMPNNTDFTVFRDHGLPGLDFAFIGDYANYHTAGDTIENLDPRSLRHHGVQALALGRLFAQLDLSNLPTTADSIYFNIPFLGVIRYSEGWALPLAGAAALAGLVVLSAGILRNQFGLAGIGWGLAAIALTVALASAVAAILTWVLPLARLNQHADVAIGGFVLISLACTLSVLSLFRERAHPLEIGAAGLIFFAILSLLSAVYAPGGSYLLVWPSIVSGIGLTICARLGRECWNAPPGAAALLVCAVPLVVLLTPITYLAFLGLRIRLAPVATGIVAIGLCPLLPHLAMLNQRGKWLAPLLCTLGAAACFGMAMAR